MEKFESQSMGPDGPEGENSQEISVETPLNKISFFSGERLGDIMKQASARGGNNQPPVFNSPGEEVEARASVVEAVDDKVEFLDIFDERRATDKERKERWKLFDQRRDNLKRLWDMLTDPQFVSEHERIIDYLARRGGLWKPDRREGPPSEWGGIKRNNLGVYLDGMREVVQCMTNPDYKPSRLGVGVGSSRHYSPETMEIALSKIERNIEATGGWEPLFTSASESETATMADSVVLAIKPFVEANIKDVADSERDKFQQRAIEVLLRTIMIHKEDGSENEEGNFRKAIRQSAVELLRDFRLHGRGLDVLWDLKKKNRKLWPLVKKFLDEYRLGDTN